jgi:hypothetical protein
MLEDLFSSVERGIDFTDEANIGKEITVYAKYLDRFGMDYKNYKDSEGMDVKENIMTTVKTFSEFPKYFTLKIVPEFYG